MKDEQLQTSFWLSEFIRSDTATRNGIDNTPPEDVLNSIRIVLAPGLQRVRNLLQVPIHISSGYRCPALNSAVKGAKNSQHLLGQAADFTAPDFGSPLSIAKFIQENSDTIRYQQLIFEGSWVHIGFPAAGEEPKLEVLTAMFRDGEVTYVGGLCQQE